MDSDTDNSIIVENKNPTIDFKWVEKAINALLKHEVAQPKKVNNDLLLADQPVTIWLTVTTFKFSNKPKLKPVSIPLKHPLYGPSTEICLITKDPQRIYKEWVTNHKVKRIQKVIGVSKLRKKYIPYEAKRKLCDSYDLFLADERVLPLLPKMLGKYFFGKKKQPVPVNISKETNFKKEILKACHCTYMHYSSGVCLSIKIGTTEMTSDQLLENLEKAIPVIIDKIPRKWKNIQSLYIKTPESTSLPIYNRLPDLPIEIPKDIKIKTSETKISGGESENEGENEDEMDEDDEDYNSEEDDEKDNENKMKNDKDDDDNMDEDKEDGKDNENKMENDDSTDEDEEDEKDDENKKNDDSTDEDEEDNTNKKKEEEKPVKKRKISKETGGVIFGYAVPKSNKNPQVKNGPNKKDKGDVYKREESSSIANTEVTVKAKKSNMKKVRGKANGAIKEDITGDPKKANVNYINKDEESNNSQANSTINKRNKSSNIMTTDISEEGKNDLLNKKISSFIAEQKKKTMEQKKVDSSKSVNNEASKSAANFGNKKVKKNVPEKDTNKTNDKSVGNSGKSEKKDKKDDKSVSSGKKNILDKKKGGQKKIDADLASNNNQTFLKRKRETSGHNKPNKESVKINNSAKKNKKK
ncbi:ribosomal protein L1 [Rhizophagus irregularis]|uniref:Ribosomal L1 domain-containing protein 1 n=1 Tax=Rhizophagus irregularis TaxID=588596 RepID=A0A2I1G7J0_9GLOM|nr:ribosomal protein L1 [Rhizophagus irregularis]